jgi:hypothetical protein
MKKETTRVTIKEKGTDAHRDPITGSAGAHPVGTGVGAASGATAGAALGSMAGPVGAAVGLVAGAVAGGLAGKAVAETIDPTIEDAFWERNHANRPYAEKGLSYDTYRPAYRTGYEGRTRYAGRKYDEVEADLERDFERTKGDSTLTWNQAKHAVRDGWHRMERAIPGDADKDGR